MSAAGETGESSRPSGRGLSPAVGLLGANVFLHSLGAVTGILAARLLAPAGRGELAALVLWPSLLAASGCLGLDRAIARRAAQFPDQSASLARFAIVAGLTLGLGQCCLLWVLGDHLFPADKRSLVPWIGLAGMLLPAGHAMLALLGLFQGRQRFGPYNIVRSLVAVLYLGGVVTLWASDRVTPVALAGIQVASIWVALLVAVALAAPFLRGSRSAAVRTRPLLREAWPFFASLVAVTAAFRADQALVVVMLPDSEVGLYAAALSFAAAHQAVGATFGTLGFSRAASLSAEGRSALFAATVRRMGAVYLPLATVMALALPWLVVPLFGDQFRAARPLIAILTFQSVLGSMTIGADETLRGAGHVVPGTVGRIAAVVVLAVSAPLLASRFQSAGVALGAVLAAAAMAATTCGLGARAMGVPWRSLNPISRVEFAWVAGQIRSTARSLMAAARARLPGSSEGRP